VQVQVIADELAIVKPPPEPELLELEEIVGEAGLDFVELEVVELLDGLGAAVKRHEQAVETLDTWFEQWVAYAGSAVVAVTAAVVNVAQKVAAFAEDAIKALKQLSWLQSRRSSWTPARTAVINEERIMIERIMAAIAIPRPNPASEYEMGRHWRRWRVETYMVEGKQ
jgi:hypothetical protein